MRLHDELFPFAAQHSPDPAAQLRVRAVQIHAVYSPVSYTHLFAVENGFDFIAASFVRTADDVVQIRTELERHDSHNMRIIAKIENGEGVDNIDEIIRVADGIMVARGDLGVEIPLEEIPVIQKRCV